MSLPPRIKELLKFQVSNRNVTQEMINTVRKYLNGIPWGNIGSHIYAGDDGYLMLCFDTTNNRVWLDWGTSSDSQRQITSMNNFMNILTNNNVDFIHEFPIEEITTEVSA